MRARGFDMDQALESGQYVALDAESVLADLMVNGRPIAALFDEFVFQLLKREELAERIPTQIALLLKLFDVLLQLSVRGRHS